MKEFKVNEYLTLKLEEDDEYDSHGFDITNIYVNGERFRQCKFLMLNIPVDKIKEYDEIKSIDEAAEKLGWTIDGQMENDNVIEYEFPPETEFWGHCSNLQVWVENDYDTRLVHSNLAFPLLKRLTEVGDPAAKRVFKDEIICRIEEGNVNILKYLLYEGYFEYFSREEIEGLSRSIISPLGRLALLGVQYEARSEFYDCFEKLKENVELTEFGIQNKAPNAFYVNFEKLKENVELAKFGIQNKAPDGFYSNFVKLTEYIELAKLGIQIPEPWAFYNNFEKLTVNIELAKWAVQNKVPNVFYGNFEKLTTNIELAKWAVQNKAPISFYIKFEKLTTNIELAKLGIQTPEPWEFYNIFENLKENVELAKWAVQNKVPYIFYREFSLLQENPSHINSLRISKEKKEDFLERFDITEENRKNK